MTQEFHLSVTPLRPDEYLVRVEQPSPGVPLGEEQVRWPVDDWLAQAYQIFTDPLAEFFRRPSLDALGGEEGSSQASSALVALGQTLYEALFQGTVRDSWVIAQGIAQHRQEVLRLRLGIKGDRLPRLPWEVLHAGSRPLAASTDVVFSRYQSQVTLVSKRPKTAFPDLALPSTLRILMVLAAPTDQANLDLMREALELKEELAQSRQSDRANLLPDIELTILEHPGREDLTQTLEQGNYQVFHFAGHSNQGPAGGQLHLVNSQTGLSETLNGDDLAGLLVNNGITLTVLNSCQGAQAATPYDFDLDGERSLAEALVRRGIPSVLAMAERIPDQVALSLSRLFYRNLKLGYPIDLSLCRARQGLISSYGSNQLYWSLPILYLQQEFSGRIVMPHQEGSEPSWVPMPEEPPLVAGVPSSRFHYRSAEGALLDPPGLDDGLLLAPLDTGLNDPELMAEVAALERDLANTYLDNTLPPELFGAEVGRPQAIAGPASVAANALAPQPLAAASAIADSTLTAGSATASATLDFDGAATTSAVAASNQVGNAPAQALGAGWAGLQRSPWTLGLGLGLAGIALATAVGVGLRQDPGPRTVIPSPGTDRPNRDVQATQPTLQEAIQAFQKGDIKGGTPALAALLDRKAIKDAETAIAFIPGKVRSQSSDPQFTFLQGRLAWEALQQKSDRYEIDDVIRFWKTAADLPKADPNSRQALAFALLENNRLEEAQAEFAKVLKTQGGNTQPPQGAAATSLNAYAGLAVTLFRSSQAKPVGQQSDLLNQAVQTYQYVIGQDPAQFAPTQLSQNWLWSQRSLAAWQALGQAAVPSPKP